MARTWVLIGDRVKVASANEFNETWEGVVVKAGPDAVEVKVDEIDGPIFFAWQDLMGTSGSYDPTDDLMGHPYYEAFMASLWLVKSWSEINPERTYEV
jgi:hypothetical protein